MNTGVLAAITASIMLFSAFTSAMMVRRGFSGDWQAPNLPVAFWLAGATIVAASLLLEIARRRGSSLLLRSAMAAGVCFLILLARIWASTPFAGIGNSFFYVLTGAHAVHAAGGLWALVVFRFRATLFWHFVGLLWVYVTLLFGVWA